MGNEECYSVTWLHRKAKRAWNVKEMLFFRFFYINETYTKKHDTLPKKTYCKTK